MWDECFSSWCHSRKGGVSGWQAGVLEPQMVPVNNEKKYRPNHTGWQLSTPVDQCCIDSCPRRAVRDEYRARGEKLLDLRPELKKDAAQWLLVLAGGLVAGSTERRHPGREDGAVGANHFGSMILKSIAIIPARFQSTRFPGKPLVPIVQKTMIQHVYERALQARSVTEVIVATDDVRILNAVEAFGGQARMTSTSHRSGTDRVAEVAASTDADVIVNVQGDEPLIDPDALDAVVEPFQADPGLMISTLSVEGTDDEHRNPNVVKVVVDHDGFALYFSRSPIPF